MPRWFAGELIGTFLLVFFGCGSVATVVAHEASVGLFQVAIVWGLGLSAAMVYALFGGAITRFEQANGITRGLPGSEASAMIFGEYFPNPGARPLTEEARQTVPHWRAALAEFFGTALLAPPFWHRPSGTALLALAIFGFTARENDTGPGPMTPLAIGFTLTALICIFAPLTMAGFNPARDLAPRLFSSLAGWDSHPFQVNGVGWLTVYLVSPCVGAIAGAGIADALHRPTRGSA